MGEDGHTDGEPEPENKVAKKKIFEGLMPDLKTDKDGQVNWKGELVKKNEAEAIKWFELSAAQGNTSAKMMLDKIKNQ